MTALRSGRTVVQSSLAVIALWCAACQGQLTAREQQQQQDEGYHHQRREHECVAFDTAERYSFESLRGLSFMFYDSFIGRSYNIQMCDEVQVQQGDIHQLDRSTDRYSTNIQGVYKEFLIDRKFDGETYKKDDTRTWGIGNLDKFRMKYLHGSQGPPCNKELKLTPGQNNHAPEYGGRESSVNIYCGGCPDWPVGWQNDPTTSFEQLCNRYRSVHDARVNHGLPSDSDFHGNTITKTDPNACVCAAQEITHCKMEFNITLSCPEAGTAFNEVKRLYFLLAFVVGMVTLSIILACMSLRKKRMHTGRSGRSLSIILGQLQAQFNILAEVISCDKLINLCSKHQVIPPPPKHFESGNDDVEASGTTVHAK